MIRREDVIDRSFGNWNWATSIQVILEEKTQ